MTRRYHLGFVALIPFLFACSSSNGGSSGGESGGAAGVTTGGSSSAGGSSSSNGGSSSGGAVSAGGAPIGGASALGGMPNGDASTGGAGAAGGAGSGGGSGGGGREQADSGVGTGPCCTAHASRGCSDTTIEQCVCDQVADCCETGQDGWDSTCVTLVSALACGTCPTNDCCTASGSPGCTDSTIQACVCKKDSSCCDSAWNALCVTEVSITAGGGPCGAACPSN